MLLDPVTKRLFFYNKLISSSVSRDGIIIEKKFNRKFIKDLYGRKIIELNGVEGPSGLDFSSSQAIKAPLNVTIQITNLCNLRCAHCHRNYEKVVTMATDDFKKIVSELRKINVFNINISGGEPTLVKDLAYMVDYVTKSGLKVTLSTNNTLINSNLARALKKSGLDQVHISLDSSISKIHNKIRGTDNAFEDMSKNLKYLRANNIHYIFVTTLLSQSLKDYRDVIDLSYKLGAKGHKTNSVIPQGRAQGKGINPALIKDYIKVWKEKKRHYEGKFEILAETMFAIQIGNQFVRDDSMPEVLNCGCPAGLLTAAINENGDILPCSFFSGLVVGNAIESSFINVWENSASLDKLRKRKSTKVCNKCQYSSSCGGCRARSYGLYGELFREDPYCLKLSGDMFGGSKG